MKPRIILKHFNRSYFLFLLPVFFVLHGYTDYYNIVFLKDAFLLLLQYLTATFIIWGLFYLLFWDWQKAALYSFILLCTQFFFGSLHDAAKNLFANSFVTKYSFILPTYLIFLAFLFIFIKKSKRQLAKLFTYLTVVLMALLAIDTMLLIPKTIYAFKKTQAALPNTFKSCDTCNKPDVYLIVADEYAGHEQLKTIFNFDNTKFEHELSKRGFQVIGNTICNYNSTPFSIASLVNMEYLHGIEQDNNVKKRIKACYDKINHSLVARFFQKQGYAIKNFSIFNFSDQSTESTFTLFPIKARLISDQTLLSRLYRDLAPTLFMKLNYKRGLEKFIFADLQSNRNTFRRTKLEAISVASQPRFIYSHLLMPHNPYYFDKNGKLQHSQTFRAGQLLGQKEDYLGYLQYCNKKFLELIDYIQKVSKAPPVIIFMSDHGYRYYDGSWDPQYQFMNINAVYLPDSKYGGFYDGMSNVNQFRVLLNTIFNQNLPLLKDSSVFIK